MKRITELDALRGIALLGILLVNIFVFHAPMSYYGEFYGVFEGIQIKTVDFVVNFAGGKFLLIFAFLFGYGIVLQQKSRSDSFNTYFVKRMLVLFVFGALHILLFWSGDILASYALLGLLIIPLLRLSNRQILTLGILFILFPAIYYLAVVLFGLPMVSIGQPVTLDNFISVFQKGSYLEVFQLRMKEFAAFAPENLVWYISKTFGLFLIGIYSARKELFTTIKNNQSKYLLTAAILIPISVIWFSYRRNLFGMVDLEIEPLWRPFFISLNVIFETALGFGYIFLFSIVFQKFEVITQILAKVGRLALTNYILQSLICVIIFYGFGFGYYGKLKPTDLVFMTIVIFSFNVVFSVLYLRFRRIGPLEFVWRKLIKQ